MFVWLFVCRGIPQCGGSGGSYMQCAPLDAHSSCGLQVALPWEIVSMAASKELKGGGEEGGGRDIGGEWLKA